MVSSMRIATSSSRRPGDRSCRGSSSERRNRTSSLRRHRTDWVGSLAASARAAGALGIRTMLKSHKLLIATSWAGHTLGAKQFDGGGACYSQHTDWTFGTGDVSTARVRWRGCRRARSAVLRTVAETRRRTNGAAGRSVAPDSRRFRTGTDAITGRRPTRYPDTSNWVGSVRPAARSGAPPSQPVRASCRGGGALATHRDRSVDPLR